MDKRIKVLLTCLAIISLLAVSISAWIYISSETKVAEYAKKQAELEKQSAYLQKKLDERQKETRHWREKFGAIKVDLDRLGKEHTLLQSQYASLLSEKESLAEQNTTLGEQVEKLNQLYSQEQEKARLSASDNFLASLLEEKAKKEVEIEKLKGRISSQEEQLEDIERQARPSQEKFERLEKESQVLENRLQDSQKVSDVLSSDLLKERKRRSSLEQELAQAQEQLKSITSERDKLSEQLVKMKQALERRLLELSQTEQVLAGAVEAAERATKKEKPASIELPPIVVKAQEETPTPRAPELSKAQIVEKETFELAGRIITVNDKHKFVVIDIGRDEGVEKGMSFDVYRKSEKVGRIEVIETRKNITACDVKEMSVKQLKVNDTVRR